MVSLDHFADRTPRALTDGEVVDLGGGKRVRFIDTPHTPHGWDAGVLYEESTRTLMCGDLFTQLGNDRALTDGDIVGPAIAAEDMFKYSCLNPGMGATIRSLSKLAPRTLALMHGPSFMGDGAVTGPLILTIRCRSTASLNLKAWSSSSSVSWSHSRFMST
jgi:flavorubredoxin